MEPRASQAAHLAETTAFDAWHLLGRAEVARVAWYDGTQVSIVPVNYAVSDGALWFRTTPESAIVRAGAGVEVAVEVDDVGSTEGSSWSVVLRSAVELVEPDQAPDSIGELRIWPAGARNVYVRLEPSEISGRKLQSRASR